MPGKTAIICYNKCHPEACAEGICTAARSCPRKVIKQEAPYEFPAADNTMCQGCSTCTQSCPYEAIELG